MRSRYTPEQQECVLHACCTPAARLLQAYRGLLHVCCRPTEGLLHVPIRNRGSHVTAPADSNSHSSEGTHSLSKPPLIATAAVGETCTERLGGPRFPGAAAAAAAASGGAPSPPPPPSAAGVAAGEYVRTLPRVMPPTSTVSSRLIAV